MLFIEKSCYGMGKLRLFRSDLFLRLPTRVSYGGGDFLRRSARSCMAAMSVMAAGGTTKVSAPSGSLKAEVEFLSDCEIDWLDAWRRRSFFKGFDRKEVSAMGAGCGLDGLGQGVGAAASLASVVRGMRLTAIGRDVMAASIPGRRGLLIRFGRREIAAAVLCRLQVGAVGLVGPSQIWVGAKAFGPGPWLIFVRSSWAWVLGPDAVYSPYYGQMCM